MDNQSVRITGVHISEGLLYMREIQFWKDTQLPYGVQSVYTTYFHNVYIQWTYELGSGIHAKSYYLKKNLKIQM